MAKTWAAEDVLSLARGFQPACVLIAAAELDLFTALAQKPATAKELSAKIGSNLRAVTMLADALAALGLLRKDAEHYSLAGGLEQTLTAGGSQSVLAMLCHLGNTMRSWAQLATVVKNGKPADRPPSIRGPQADLEAFIEAMDDLCRPMADSLVRGIGPPKFGHLLDLGAGPATWTIAFLQARPQAKATIFDLPEVIPIARKHICQANLLERVSFVGGDFNADRTLPAGADLAWISAIVHMNSRAQNRALFAKVRGALVDGGRILIRDVIMDEQHTVPAEGALFAINMLVNTAGGGTFSLSELSEDLSAAGFCNPLLLHRGEFMDSVVQAEKA